MSIETVLTGGINLSCTNTHTHTYQTEPYVARSRPSVYRSFGPSDARVYDVRVYLWPQSRWPRTKTRAPSRTYKTPTPPLIFHHIIIIIIIIIVVVVIIIVIVIIIVCHFQKQKKKRNDLSISVRLWFFFKIVSPLLKPWRRRQMGTEVQSA